MHPKIEKPGLLLYKTGSFGSEFWPKSQKLFGSTARRKVFQEFSPGVSSPGPLGSTRPGDAGRGAASLPPGQNLSRSYTASSLGGGGGSGGSARDARARDPRPIPGLGAGACRAGGRHRAWRCPSPTALSEEACASIEPGGRRVNPMCAEHAARPAAALAFHRNTPPKDPRSGPNRVWRKTSE